MKAAKHYHRQWEEINFLRLMILSDHMLKYGLIAILKLKIAFSISSYLVYQIFLFLFRVIKLSLLGEVKIRPEKDEAWIFRQIK